MELCADNIILYHNPSSSAAPMYGRYFGVEGFLMWLQTCQEELGSNGKPVLFNFSASGNYVFCEMEATVTVKKTAKKLTLSRIMKFVFDAEGKFVVWDIMEDSAPLEQVCREADEWRGTGSRVFVCLCACFACV